MALVTMKEMLAEARSGKYAVAAFDVCNLEMVRAVAETAEEEKAPVILMGMTRDIQGVGVQYIAELCKIAAKNASVPVAVHFDHGQTVLDNKRCIDAGFTSVMFDGSSLSLEENIKGTREVVAYAHPKGVTVEAELGHVTTSPLGGEGQYVPEQKAEDFYTDPEDVKYFVEHTDVDCLAIAVGTVHGVYVKKPEMQFALLERINAISKVPLVLHGGSGTPDDDIRRCVELGICKLNIFSEMLAAMNKGYVHTFEALKNPTAWPYMVQQEAMDNLRELVRNKIRLCSSNGKAK